MNTEQDKAKEVIRLLDESIGGLDQKILGRLSSARKQAVAAHAQARLVPATAGSLAHILGDYFHHHRVMVSTLAIVGAVLMTILISQQFNANDTGQYGDAFLLGSELPPEAYVDKGFDVWLEDSSN